MYVPIIKNKNTEIKIVSESLSEFGNLIIPLVEIVSTQKKKIYAKREGKRFKEEDEYGENHFVVEGYDNITIETIKKLASLSTIFVQYFRYDFEQYSPQMDQDVRDVAYKNGQELDSYIDSTRNLFDIENVIPVIIIKPFVNNGLHLTELHEFILEMKQKGRKLGLRIDIRMIRKYEQKLNEMISLLSESDYVFYDFLERKIVQRDLRNILFSSISSNKVLLHAYRKRDRSNFEYSVGEHETDFDTSYFKTYNTLGYDGFGDYIGLPDTVPYSNMRAKYSTAFLYDLDENKYFSYRSQQLGKVNVYTGRGGNPDFPQLKTLVLGSSRVIHKNQFANCPAIYYIKNNLKSGGYFPQWKIVTVKCHINAMKIKMGV